LKFHLVGETVGSFFCINSLGVHIILEDLEKDVYSALYVLKKPSELTSAKPENRSQILLH
jgi:hypothetical protein